MDYTTLLLDRSNGSLYTQLADVLGEAMLRGDLAVGERLPSERDLAQALNLSRNTVVAAYHELQARGLVRSHVGRGTFVCASAPEDRAPFAWNGKVARGAQRTLDATLRTLVGANHADLISFGAGGPAFDKLPAEALQLLIDTALRRDPVAALGYGPAEGLPRLREELALRFGVRPAQIMALTGAQQGLDLISRCLLDPGDAVIMDRPGYLGAIQTFRSAGAHLVGWDAEAADLNELEDVILRYRPKLLYTVPTFQNPTGRTLTLDIRRELLVLAARYRLPIIEDEPYRELYFGAPPPPTLYALDQHQLVIHLSTFSKTLAPGLRLGWLAAAEPIIDQLSLLKARSDVFSPGLSQVVVADLLASRTFDDHLKRMRAEYARRHTTLVQALRRELLPDLLSWRTVNGGMYLWCRLREGTSSRLLFQRAQNAGVLFVEGAAFFMDPAGDQFLRLCFSTLPPDKIIEGVRRLAPLLAEVTERHSTRETHVLV